MSQENHTLPPEARAALQANDKVQAVKLTQEKTGLGLQEAMALVDSHVAADSGLAGRFRPSGCSPVLFAALIAILVIGYFFWSGSGV